MLNKYERYKKEALFFVNIMGISNVVNLEHQKLITSSILESNPFNSSLYADFIIGGYIGIFSAEQLGKVLEARPEEMLGLGLMAMGAGAYLGARYLRKLYQ